MEWAKTIIVKMCIICMRVVYGEVRLIIAFRRECSKCTRALCVCLFIHIYIYIRIYKTQLEFPKWIQTLTKIDVAHQFC